MKFETESKLYKLHTAINLSNKIRLSQTQKRNKRQMQTIVLKGLKRLEAVLQSELIYQPLII